MSILSNSLMDKLLMLQKPTYALDDGDFGAYYSDAGCGNTCAGSCSGSCSGDCEYSCSGDCEHSCSSVCEGMD